MWLLGLLVYGANIQQVGFGGELKNGSRNCSILKLYNKEGKGDFIL